MFKISYSVIVAFISLTSLGFSTETILQVEEPSSRKTKSSFFKKIFQPRSDKDTTVKTSQNTQLSQNYSSEWHECETKSSSSHKLTIDRKKMKYDPYNQLYYINK